MKKHTQLALLIAAACAATSTVRAAYTSGDLLVGFTSAGAANDYMFDVGPVSGLTYGETWTLGSDLGGTFTSAQFQSASWGVIGALTSTKTIYSSAGIQGVPGPVANLSTYNAIHVNVISLGQSSIVNTATMPAQSSANSWYSQTDQAAGTPGNFFFNNLANPNVSTAAMADVYALDDLGDPGSELGAFTISANGNTLTYIQVPEPGVASLLGGFGLLALRLRRRFAHNA